MAAPLSERFGLWPRLFAVLAVGLLAASPVRAACQFDASGTIINPQDPSCGDVRLRYTRADNSGTNIALGYDVPFPVDSLTPVDGFRSYQSLFERHQSLDAEHATVSGAVVGQTLAGRDIWAYRIGDEDNETVDGGIEPAAMINGTIHAREWQSPEAVTEIFETLVDGQGDASFGAYLSENLNVVILPVHNVDGFLVTQKYPDLVTASEVQPREGRMRRKNRRHPSGGGPIDDDIDTTADNFWGVDLNRNSARGWGQNNGSSGNPVSLVNRGPSPASEPEIEALIAAADQLAPSARLRFYTDVHSFSQIYFTPLTGNARRDAITETLVSRMRAVLGNKYRWGPAASSGIGLTSDYFARNFQIPAWTLETEPLQGGIDYGGTAHGHSGFILPATEVARMREEVAIMVLAGLYRQSDPPRLQAIRITDRDSGELRYAADWRSDGDGRRLRRTQDESLVPGGRYRLWLAFNKPMRWRLDNGEVGNFPGQNVTLLPRITLELPTLGNASVDIPVTVRRWLDEPDAPGSDGYIRYRDDALLAEFSVPGSLTVATAPAVLSVVAEDVIEAALDGDPATRVDWSGGHWTGYEDAAGVASDLGGADCQFVTYVASDPSAAAPAGRNQTFCRASGRAPDPDGNPSGGNASGGGGGGGGAVLWLLPLFMTGRLVGRRKRR